MTLLVSLSVATSVCGAPSSPVLPGPGAVEAVLADYDDQLRSGRLHEDASRASRVEGGLRDHYAAWADAFSAALRNDAEAPRRIEAMHRLAGYLGGVERYTELRDLYVSLAEVEPMPGEALLSLALHRDRGLGDFERREREALRLIGPEIARGAFGALLAEKLARMRRRGGAGVSSSAVPAHA